MKYSYIAKMILLCISIIMTSMMSGCMEELEAIVTESENICFTGNLEEEVSTKGFTINKLSGNHAGVIGYYGKYSTSGGVTTGQFTYWSEQLNNKEYIFDGDLMGVYTEDGQEINSVKWNSFPAGSTHLRIYSYVPATLKNATQTPENASPTLTYTVPSDVSEQIDVITAFKEVPSTTRERIPLEFSHALTAIQFRNGVEGKIQSIRIEGVANKGTYDFETGTWNNLSKDLSGQATDTKFEIQINSETVIEKGQMLTSDQDETVFLMIPQSFDGSSTAKITLTYIDSNDEIKSISTSLVGASWKAGDMITYTLNEKVQDSQEYIYFDLAAGNVNISSTGYSGSVYINNGASIETFSGTHDPNNKYYVYQSTEANKSSTGWSGERESSDFKPPQYDPVTYNGQLWSDWITNNQNVEDVIEIWDDGKYIRSTSDNAPNERHIGIARVRDVGRTHTFNYITVTGSNTDFNIVIDNIYSAIQERVRHSEQTFRNRQKGGISYMPSGNTKLTVNFIGDNRMGCLHIDNNPSDKIILEGTGSLTVASTDFVTAESEPKYANDFGASTGYIGNFWNSAIGTNTYSTSTEPLYNLHINGGVIFAGTTAAEDCTAIGGGGNGLGQVFINGGTVTAVATTAGTAIGGGMGHSAEGGPGEVTITGGNIYAYNFRNIWGIPSSAIGGGGSYSAQASYGTVNISGGYIYAHSVLGTAIGGGSSKNISGGNATINISGGHIVARSEEACGIGGGTGGLNQGVNGGSAIINISGNPIIRTGSIGGGKTNNSTGKIGQANITVSGGDIQAQFVMAAGASTSPSFTMTSGLIRNSRTSERDDDPEFPHTQHKGGAVYLEEGTFTMTGGEIHNCSSDAGGAIYVKGQGREATFTMTGGKITECVSNTSGGAVYLENGSVYLYGGEISGNLARSGNGGGICIVGGNFSMNSPLSNNDGIMRNAAFGGNGGGLYVTSTGNNVDVDLISGNIISNSSDKYGGGICIDMAGLGAAADITVGIYDDEDGAPVISGNHATLEGGGLYAKGSKANITINNGTIADNNISGYEANPNVANEGGMVTLNGGNVTHVEVTYNNNFAYYGDEPSSVKQNIVTATNSTMIVPVTFDKLGYRLVGWNTRPDGKGTSYEEGQILNLNDNLTLYAQWTLN